MARKNHSMLPGLNNLICLYTVTMVMLKAKKTLSFDDDDDYEVDGA